MPSYSPTLWVLSILQSSVFLLNGLSQKEPRKCTGQKDRVPKPNPGEHQGRASFVRQEVINCMTFITETCCLFHQTIKSVFHYWLTHSTSKHRPCVVGNCQRMNAPFYKFSVQLRRTVGTVLEADAVWNKTLPGVSMHNQQCSSFFFSFSFSSFFTNVAV